MDRAECVGLRGYIVLALSAQRGSEFFGLADAVYSLTRLRQRQGLEHADRRRRGRRSQLFRHRLRHRSRASGAVLSNDNTSGMGYAYADDNSKTYTVACTKYCSSDTFVFPVPKGAKPSTGSDHHLAVIHGNQELDV